MKLTELAVLTAGLALAQDYNTTLHTDGVNIFVNPASFISRVTHQPDQLLTLSVSTDETNVSAYQVTILYKQDGAVHFKTQQVALGTPLVGPTLFTSALFDLGPHAYRLLSVNVAPVEPEVNFTFATE